MSGCAQLEVWLIAVAGLDGLQDFPKGGPSASGPAVRLASGISLVAEPVENLPTEKLFAAACKLQSAYEVAIQMLHETLCRFVYSFFNLHFVGCRHPAYFRKLVLDTLRHVAFFGRLLLG
eukprot:GHVT01009327.1.p1 GENE.GHVT01009327.1~~GHVT01009327.1.p1  ORF type:complete len:120 (+),score=10.83 GHVT01009327.1:480-839(+)